MEKIKDIFHVNYGVNLEYYKMELDENGLPFISRTAQNNGVIGRVTKIEGITPNPRNTISVTGGGSVLEAFLQEEEYYSGRDVYYLKPRDELNKTQLLYYCMLLKANKYRYNYGRQANKTLGEILVPSIDEVPDWAREIKIPARPTEDVMTKERFSLSDRKWCFFTFDDLFFISSSKDTVAERLEAGIIPYVSSTFFDNGVSRWVAEEPGQGANTITVARNGSVGAAFYQPYPYCASPDDIRIFKLKGEFNIFIGMFLTTIIGFEKYRFNYGRKWGTSRMKQTKVKLPVDNEERPDWQFMENYIKNLPYSKNLKKFA